MLDGFKILSVKDALKKIENYDYALIYYISESRILSKKQFDNIMVDEIVDARFFSNNGELHIYNDDDELKASEIIENELKSNNDFIDKKYIINNDKRFNNFKKENGISDNSEYVLTVREYLQFDEDGQCEIALTRLASIEPLKSIK